MQKIIVLVGILLLAGCAGELTAQRTQNLRVGMAPTEVKTVLGEPNSTQMMDGTLLWKYLLVESAFNIAPYYLIFSAPDQRLETWFIDRSGKDQEILANWRARKAAN